jgi:hypothetical protein
MTYCTYSYPRRKCSRHHRFPAPPPLRVRAINSALLCRCEGCCDRASLLPVDNSSTRSNYEGGTLEAVTMRRALPVEVEIVKPDHAETDRVWKSRPLSCGRKECSKGRIEQ